MGDVEDLSWLGCDAAFEVLTAMLLRTHISWDMVLYCWVNGFHVLRVPQSFETWSTTHPTTQCHIPRDLSSVAVTRLSTVVMSQTNFEDHSSDAATSVTMVWWGLVSDGYTWWMTVLVTATHTLCKTASHENVVGRWSLYPSLSAHQLQTQLGLFLHLEPGLALPVAGDHQSHWHQTRGTSPLRPEHLDLHRSVSCFCDNGKIMYTLEQVNILIYSENGT